MTRHLGPLRAGDPRETEAEASVFYDLASEATNPHFFSAGGSTQRHEYQSIEGNPGEPSGRLVTIERLTVMMMIIT